jgi:alpha-N-arabinofuranosidase
MLEDIYTMEDALAVGCMLITLLNNANRVKIACLAQLVNVIAPIMTVTGGSAWRQTIFYPFMHASKYGRGTVLCGAVKTGLYDSKDYTDVPWLESAVVYNKETETLTVFAVNRNLAEALDLTVWFGGFEGMRLIHHIALFNADLKAVNSMNHEAVKPVILAGGKIMDSTLEIQLPPASWNVIKIRINS